MKIERMGMKTELFSKINTRIILFLTNKWRFRVTNLISDGKERKKETKEKKSQEKD